MSRVRIARSSMLLSSLTGALLLSMTGCVTEDGSVEGSVAEASQAVSAKILRATKPVAGQYIVVLKGGELSALGQKVTDVSAQMVQSVNGVLMYDYEVGLLGFAAKMTEADAKSLAADPRVDYIEEDGYFELNATQTNATWGLDRIDQRTRPLSTTYNFTSTGANVHSYVIDTGIRLTHNEFIGSLGNGFDAITSGGSANDCQGHGSHVGGTMGGTTFGVAKNTILHPVRVFGCTGSTTTAAIVAGVNWVTSNRILPAVANMSLGGGISTAMESAIQSSINSGVSYVVAAGNSAANACNTSPARMPAALTVAASSITDASASFTNFGSCVDLYAPGVSVTSAGIASNSATATFSGTSMASPHVAGVVARYLQGGNQSPANVHAHIVSTSTANVVTGVPAGTPNRLLFRDPAQ